jgi:hypothetical protein
LKGGGTDDEGIGRGDPLQASRQVRGFAKRYRSSENELEIQGWLS